MVCTDRDGRLCALAGWPGASSPSNPVSSRNQRHPDTSRTSARSPVPMTSWCQANAQGAAGCGQPLADTHFGGAERDPVTILGLVPPTGAPAVWRRAQTFPPDRRPSAASCTSDREAGVCGSGRERILHLGMAAAHHGEPRGGPRAGADGPPARGHHVTPRSRPSL